MNVEDLLELHFSNTIAGGLGIVCTYDLSGSNIVFPDGFIKWIGSRYTDVNITIQIYCRAGSSYYKWLYDLNEHGYIQEGYTRHFTQIDCPDNSPDSFSIYNDFIISISGVLDGTTTYSKTYTNVIKFGWIVPITAFAEFYPTVGKPESFTLNLENIVYSTESSVKKLTQNISGDIFAETPNISITGIKKDNNRVYASFAGAIKLNPKDDIGIISGNYQNDWGTSTYDIQIRSILLPDVKIQAPDSVVVGVPAKFKNISLTEGVSGAVYKWYVDGVKKGQGDELEYAFDDTNEHVVVLKGGFDNHVNTASVTVHPDYGAEMSFTINSGKKIYDWYSLPKNTSITLNTNILDGTGVVSIYENDTEIFQLEVPSGEYSKTGDIQLTIAGRKTSKLTVKLVTSKGQTVTKSVLYQCGRAPGTLRKDENLVVDVNGGIVNLELYSNQVFGNKVEIPDMYFVYIIVGGERYEMEVGTPTIELSETSSAKITIPLKFNPTTYIDNDVYVTYNIGIKDEYGDDLKRDYVQVRLVPSCDFTYETPVSIGDETTFTNTSTECTTSSDYSFKYIWKSPTQQSTYLSKSDSFINVFQPPIGKQKVILEGYLCKSGVVLDTYKNTIVKEIDVKYSPIPEPEFTLSPSYPFIGDEITATFQNPQEGITCKWFVDSEELSATTTTVKFTIDTPGKHTITLRLTDGKYHKIGKKEITVQSLDIQLKFSVSPEKEFYDEGDNVYFTNTTSTTLSLDYEWYVNGSGPIKSKDYMLIVGIMKSYNIELRGKYRTHEFTPVSKTIYTSNRIAISSRIFIVIFNGRAEETYYMFDREQFVDLTFERRLNEIGTGSVKIIYRADTNDLGITYGSYIVVFFGAFPVFYGVITKVNDINNVPYMGDAKYKYVDIDFNDVLKTLSYTQYDKNEVASGMTVKDICWKLIPSYNRGDFSETNTYTYSLSQSDIISQLDSFNEQNNCRYRSRPKIYYTGKCVYLGNYKFKSNKQIKGTSFLIGNIVLTDGNSFIFASKFELGNDGYTYTLYNAYGEIEPNVECIIVICQGFVIDNKETYYGSPVLMVDGGELTVNKTCYDVDSLNNISKTYGNIICTSKQSKGLDTICTIPITSEILPDNSFKYSGYISSSKTTTIKDIITEVNPSTQKTYVRYIELYGQWSVSDVKNFKMRYTYESSVSGKSIYIPLSLYKFDLGKDVVYDKYENGIYSTIIMCEVIQDIKNSKNIFTITTDMINSLIDVEIGTMEYDIIGNIPIPPSGDNKMAIRIGGTSLHDVKYTKIDSGLHVDTTNAYDNVYKACAYPVHYKGTLVLPSEDNAEDNTPYILYKTKIMNTTVQSNLGFNEVEILASNIARYGSNFTSECTGSCSLKNWLCNEYYKLPDPGECIRIRYPSGDAVDYELVSYTVNADRMTVDFNVGMKPLNIGDVIYRIGQNISTNITQGNAYKN